MHTKLKFAILAAFSAAAFAAAPVHAAYSVYSDPDCGPKVESSAWFIDYSGTMQEKRLFGNYRANDTYREVAPS
ncbi:hypothetical protein, partial [uncultured Sutterella sp.]|uniref:hypothetical protein n=1 Tax=uncultured Sutterella sp. TaxID=286133 RepID=UPI0025E14761